MNEPDIEFTQADPIVIETGRAPTQWRVSKDICENFLNSGHRAVQLDLSTIKTTPISLLMSLRGYVQRHQLPIRVYQRGGKIRLARTGDWTPKDEVPPMKEV